MARTEAGTSAASVGDFGAFGIVDPPLLAAAVVAVATRETADRSAAPRASARREEGSRTVHLHEAEIGRSYLGNIRNLVQKTVALNSPLARVGPRRTPFDDAPTGDVGVRPHRTRPIREWSTISDPPVERRDIATRCARVAMKNRRRAKRRP